MPDNEPREEVIACMDAIFEVAELIIDEDVTIPELEQIIVLSVADGHQQMILALAMVQLALNRVFSGRDASR